MMTLNSDGTFSGDFHDSDMGATGSGYPNGMRSESIFTGKFSNLRKIDENTFVATVASLNVSDTIGRQYVEDGVLITVTEVYGMKQGQTAVFARQGRTVSDIGEEAKIWIYPITGQELGTTLPRTSIFIGGGVTIAMHYRKVMYLWITLLGTKALPAAPSNDDRVVSLRVSAITPITCREKEKN